ncbi:unnamed protein product [Rhizoctonia solani]|uniref:NAD(P)-binding protein n=1 Tax=Rhizoctonia solani TaxID=456999 RepID=A0A8H3G9G0_9AGAM|nr:unnamed protein product [Rhizoctonia solani]
MGNIYSAYTMAYPPKALFTVEQIPDLTGQVIIVTGGNTGIGKETCKALLEKNAKVYLAARSKSKADEAIKWLKNQTNGKVATFLELDLAHLASIRKAAEDFQRQVKYQHELHVLFNNAGVMSPPVDQRTTDGYDLQFGTNVLGHYFFTSLLLPTLIHTAKNSPVAQGHTRVVNTSSMGAFWAPKKGIIWEALGTDADSVQACKKLGTNWLYCQSKLGNVIFSNELARRYGEQGIISSSVHPGIINTELPRHLPQLFAGIYSLFLYPASQGALTQLWAGTTPEGLNYSGKFLIPWARVGDTPPGAGDEKLAEKLWTWLEEQVKGH